MTVSDRILPFLLEDVTANPDYYVKSIWNQHFSHYRAKEKESSAK